LDDNSQWQQMEADQVQIFFVVKALVDIEFSDIQQLQ